MPLFYAYIANVRKPDYSISAIFVAHRKQNVDEGRGHLLAVFASRAVADEWWRAVSTSTHARFIKRAASQFYTYDALRCNLAGFFYMPQFKPIADTFRGQIFLTQLNDKTGLGTTIIPPQEITDHVSGGWYHIRSVSDRGLYWHYDAVGNEIQASNTERTRFRINIHNCKGMPEGTIMVGNDPINLHVTSQLHVYAEQSGQLKMRAGLPGDFRFRQLESGNFATSKDATVVFVDSAESTLQLWSWELVPALSPTHNDMTPESFDADNVDNASDHSTARHAYTASSAGIGFERSKYGMYFFIREKGTATYLTSDHGNDTEGTQIMVHPRSASNSEKVIQIFFIDSYGALHHAASGLAVDIVDDVLCLRRRRPVSGRPNPWSRPLPEFSLVNSQLRVKFLSDPSLPSCTDDFYPDDSWATKNFLLASHTEKDFHFHPLSDFSPWIPPAMAGSFAYATSTRHEKDRRVLVEEMMEDFGGARTSWEIVPYNKA